jgi:hypothetical protein
MLLQEVGEKAAKNRRFAAELKAAVTAARRDGLGSAAWKRLASYFAETDEELRLLSPAMPKAGGRTNTETTTVMLTLSDTDPTVGTTTTTTTTSRLCSLPGVCKRNQPKPARKKKTVTARKTRVK